MNFKEICEKTLERPIQIAKTVSWESSEKYSLWSAQTYHFVKHSTRLFALAAARCPIEDNDFHFRYLKHLNDEKGHEHLSTNDMKTLGYSISDLPELPQTRALYQTQYYWIEHISPYSFFGYLLALEGLAVKIGPEVFKRVRDAHGEKASKFLKIHTEEDIAHLSEVYGWIERMDAPTQEAVVKNLEQSSEIYAAMLDSINDFSAGALKTAS